MEKNQLKKEENEMREKNIYLKLLPKEVAERVKIYS
jgi:hypothetical protein